MSNRIWFLADTHFGLKNDKEDWLNDFCGYFNDVVIPLMKKEYRDGDILVHLGDVFDNRSTIGLNTICKTIDLFEEFSKIFNDIRIIVGNHDIYNKSTNDITSLKMLGRIPNVKIYYNPVVETISNKTILFNPWINSIDDENKLLASVDVDYIFGHFDVNGCQLNSSGIRSKSDSGINSDDFKKSVVYAGHIHKKQDFKNVHYVGTPYQITRGDIGGDNGITVLDVESGETTFYENTYSAKYMNVSIYEILDKTIGELKTEWNNYFVDLHIKGKDAIQCRFDDFVEELQGHFKEFFLKSDNSDSIADNVSSSISPDDRKTTDEHIDQWLKDNDVEGEKYNTIIELYKKYKEQI